MCIRFIISIVFIFPLFLLAQEQPPILGYTSEEYQAANQNWAVAQGNDMHIYVANNEGLLEFDGAEWHLYASPNETVVRSVAVVDNKIYTGCYMEFGYWERNERNELQYTSLSDRIKEKILEDEQFWKIESYSDWILFQSLNQIYIYHKTDGTFHVITPENGIVKMFVAGGNILYQSPGKGVFEVKNGQPSLWINNEILNKERVINIFPYNEGYMVVMESSGLYSISESGFERIDFPVNDLLENLTVYCAEKLQNDDLALGTISQGVVIITKSGILKYHIKQTNGLINNTVLSVFEDSKNNLWLGLDNGINCLNMQSPIQIYHDGNGILGTVYTSFFFNNNLYIGTNQGLFYKKQPDAPFQLVPGTKGQVWSLFKYDNQLFCGHNIGTLLIESNKARLISPTDGTWKFSEVPGRKDIILQGGYYGLGVLKKSLNGNWVFSHKIEGFDFSSKHFELKNENEVYVSHEYKGIFKILLDKELNKVLKVEKLESPGKGKNASLAKFNGTLYFANNDGIFEMRPSESDFKKDSLLSRELGKGKPAFGKLIADETGKLWMFGKDNLSYITPGKLTNNPTVNYIPIPFSLRKTINGYENITHLEDNKFLAGFTDGYFTLDLDKLAYNPYQIKINDVTYFDVSMERSNLPVAGNVELDYNKNNISFSYSVAEYERFLIPEYQYMLEGSYDQWSSWTTDSGVSFKNLSFGSYTFKVRAKIGNRIGETATYPFYVNRPWYFSNAMVALYLSVFLIVAWLIHKAYKGYYKKQQAKLIADNRKQLEIKQLENEQELMKMRNEQLRKDVESKNRELAVSTMSLINKNEILLQIKDELIKEGDLERNIKSVVNTIRQNTREENNWNFFKEAFNNADSNFLKKAKALHPNLTPNDLRLCAYLRLNLSSKEIAPLLNISVRSVEIKRYRLRKKIDLPHEKSLVEYILNI